MATGNIEGDKMEPLGLVERLRGIMRAGAVPDAIVSTPADVVAGSASHDLSLESVLGGSWRSDVGGRCFVVEQRTSPDSPHGRARIGDVADTLDRQAKYASFLTGGVSGHQPFFFFDLETTGLSGGAGTCAFLVGCGWFADEGAFVTRQYLLAGRGHERPMLESVRAELQQAGTLVSFNGKSFDAPVLETRYLFHRLEWPGAGLPHLDVLHPARRFWGNRATGGGDSCSLAGLEHKVLGAGRQGDVPGFEIPGRYFHFVRSGDPRPLVAVLEHNRLDLLSLASLTARLLQLVGGGAGEALDGHEALALGKLYSRAGDEERACDAFERAIAIGKGPEVTVEALRSIALTERRARRHDRAAVRWRQLLDCPGCPSRVVREATEALAIHHEHRLRDLEAAKAFALRSANEAARPEWAVAVRHRIARIERKLLGGRPLLR